MMAAFVLANSTSGFAQVSDKDKLYETFIGCYKTTDKQQKDACYTGTAKTFLDSYEKDNDDYTKFVRKQYDKYLAAIKAEADAVIYDRFNNAVKNPQSVNADDAISSGREIIAKNPDLVDVPIVLASVGFDNASAKTPNDKYNNDAINYAKMAIQKIEAGKTSENYGAYAYSYKTKEFPDGKNNALGWMNYYIGYIMFNRMNQKKEALPYFYKASQFTSGTKNYPELYRTIGSWYVDEFIKLDTDRVAKINAAGGKDTDETLALLALQKGYADRAVEAYARAYAVAGNDAANKAYKDSLLSRVKELYAIRFNKDMTGFDAYIAAAPGKPFTDPATAVVPVVEAVPATSNGASEATTMTNTATPQPTISRSAAAATTATTTATKTTSAGGSTTTTTTTVTTTPKTAAKAPVTTAKKPVVKKKGTR